MKKQTQLVITKGLSTALTFDTGSFDFFEIDERDLADSKLARSNCCLHNDTHENKVMIRIAFDYSEFNFFMSTLSKVNSPLF